MRSRPKTSTTGAVCALALFLLPCSVSAQAPKTVAPPVVAHSAPLPSAPTPAPLPDYGGRESSPVAPAAASGEDGPASPLAQAWRAFESLVIVLALVVVVLFLLKRYNLVKADGSGGRLRLPPSWDRLWPPSTSSAAPGQPWPLTILSSQPLPGGGMLHLVSVADRTLLLGATAQNVALIAELNADAAGEGDDTGADTAAFAEYLSRAGVADPTSPTTRSVRTRMGAAGERLQSVLARSREVASEETEP